jgi:hypothetical protein
MADASGGPTPIYISVVADWTSSYVLKVETYFGELSNFSNTLENFAGNLDLGFVENGSIPKGQFKTHYLTLQNSQPTLHELSLKLHSRDGYANIYVKACDTPMQDCKFTTGDLETPESTQFKKNQSFKDSKEIIFPVFCPNNFTNTPNPDSSQVKCLNTYKTIFKSHGLYKSENCIFIIAIQAPKFVKGQTEIIRYNVSVHDLDSDQLISDNFSEKISMMPDQYKHFKFGVFNAAETLGKIEITFDTFFGFHEICIAKSEKRPMNFDTDCKVRKAYDGVNQGLYDNFGVFDLTAGTFGGENLMGSYYIVVHAMSYTSLSLRVKMAGRSEKIDSHEGKIQNFYKELKSGAYVTEKMIREDDTKLYYFDTSNLAGNQDSFSVSISPVVGKFIMAIRNDGIEPTLGQKHWVTNENHFMITAQDPMYKKAAKYVVKVWPLVLPEKSIDTKHGGKGRKGLFSEINGFLAELDADEKALGQELEELSGGKISEKKKPRKDIYYFYSIRYIHIGKSVTLIPGRQETGNLLDMEQCFIAEIFSGVKSLLVLKSLHNSNMYMYSFLGIDSDSEKTKTSLNQLDGSDLKEKFADNHTTGIFYSETEIADQCKSYFANGQACDLNICLQGKIHSRYSIAFTFDEKPFILSKENS